MSAVDEGPMPMMIEGGAPQAAVEDPSTQLWQRGCVEGVSLVGLVYPASFAYPLVVRQPRRAGHLLRAAPLSEAVRVSALLGFNLKGETMVLLHPANGNDLGMAANIERAIEDEVKQDEMPPSSQGSDAEPSELVARVLRLTRTFMSRHMLKEVPHHSKDLPPNGPPLDPVGPGFTFNGEYTNAVDGYLEKRNATRNKDCLVFIHQFLLAGIGTCRHRAVIIYQLLYTFFRHQHIPAVVRLQEGFVLRLNALYPHMWIEFRDDHGHEFCLETQGAEDVHATAGIWIAPAQDCYSPTGKDPLFMKPASVVVSNGCPALTALADAVSPVSSPQLATLFEALAPRDASQTTLGRRRTRDQPIDYSDAQGPAHRRRKRQHRLEDKSDASEDEDLRSAAGTPPPDPVSSSSSSSSSSAGATAGAAPSAADTAAGGTATPDIMPPPAATSGSAPASAPASASSSSLVYVTWHELLRPKEAEVKVKEDGSYYEQFHRLVRLEKLTREVLMFQRQVIVVGGVPDQLELPDCTQHQLKVHRSLLLQRELLMLHPPLWVASFLHSHWVKYKIKAEHLQAARAFILVSGSPQPIEKTFVPFADQYRTFLCRAAVDGSLNSPDNTGDFFTLDPRRYVAQGPDKDDCDGFKVGDTVYRLDGIDAPEADMGYPELVQAFANRIRGATMILARRCGRLSYERHVIQAWLIDRDSAENFTVTSLSLEAVAKGWARYAPYLKKQPDAPRELLETAQKPEVMEEAEKVAEQKKLGMFARDGAPTLKQIEAHRAAKKGPTSEQNA